MNGDELRRIRLELKWTQKGLTRALGYTVNNKTMVARWEYGKSRVPPPVSVLMALFSVGVLPVGVDNDQIYKRSGAK